MEDILKATAACLAAGLSFSVFDQPVKQGALGPCLVLLVEEEKLSRETLRDYKRSTFFKAQYIPDPDQSLEDMSGIAFEIFDCLKKIPFEKSFCFAQDFKWKVKEGILNISFCICQRVYLHPSLEEEDTELMGEMHYGE